MGICWSLSSSLKPEHGLPSGSPKSAYSGAGTESCGDSVPSFFTWGETKSVEATNLKNFTYSELKSATRNFRSDGFLGEGAAGCVYKGWIHEKTLSYTIPGKGMLVSVKKLNHQSAQSQEEWLSDVKYLGQLSHPDLVKMIGYCAEDDYRLLVYGFMTNGSLENQLFRRRFNAEPLSWAMRLKIAIAAANGLAYLHRNEIIHKNFKSSNILLDTEFNAKLVDFGVSVDLAMETAGKYGYAAPEYVAVGHLSIKSDVYSFGVVLLELLTGLRATDNQRILGGKALVQWAKPYLKNKKLQKIMDPALEGQISVEAGRAVAKLVLQCLHKDPSSRPVMNKIITRLQRLQNE